MHTDAKMITDKQRGDVEIEAFLWSTAWGFMMHCHAPNGGYSTFSERLFEVGLVPDLQRIKGDHYEVFVEVPDGWKPEAVQ